MRVGRRHEGPWRSWLPIVDDWQRFLRPDGAEPVLLKAGGRVSDESAATRADVRVRSDDVDCGVAVLGTRRSCTSKSVHDAVTHSRVDRQAGRRRQCARSSPSTGATEPLGHPELKVLVLPYPLEARAEPELRQIAADYYPKFQDLPGTVG